MKIRITFFLLGMLLTSSLFSQDLMNHIPADASMIVKLNGENLLDKMDFETMRNLPSVKKFIEDATNRKTDDMAEIGVNWDSGMYFFIASNDTMTYFCMLLDVNDKDKFADNFISPYDKMFQDGDLYRSVGYNEMVEWNDDFAIFMAGKKINDYDYDYYYGDYTSKAEYENELWGEYLGEKEYEYTETEEIEMMEAAEIIEQIEEAPKEEPKEAIEFEDETEFEDDIIYEYEEGFDNETEEYEIYDENNAYDEEYSFDYYSSGLNSTDHGILMYTKYLRNLEKSKSASSNPDISKDFEVKSDASFMMDSNKITNLMPSIFGGGMRMIPYGTPTSALLANNKIKSNLFFEDDRIFLSGKVDYHPELADAYKRIYDAQVNKNFFNYLPSKNPVGYYAAALNTQAFLEEMPKTIQGDFNSMMGTEMDYSAIIDLYSLLLDEKAIGELINGDFMFVVNSIRPIQIEYSVYDYDDNFERTERTETKEEMLPEFLFMLSSGNTEMVEKLLNLTTLSNNFIKSDAGYYEMKASEYDPMQLFMLQKNGIFFICNSREQLNYILKDGGKSKLSKQHIDDINSNTAVLFVDGEKILSNLQLQYLSREESLQLEFAAENVKQMKMKQLKMKDNSTRTETVIDIPKGYDNSFQYLIKLMDQIYIRGGVN